MNDQRSIMDGLPGHCLIAMPGRHDSFFARTVIYLCAYTAKGAMGLVINRPIVQISFSEILKQIGINHATPECDDIHVHFGGPVESQRGFILHTLEYKKDGTLPVDDQIALTATVDVLRDISVGKGPQQSFITVGYAGWEGGQLDEEIRDNAWLMVAADESLLFTLDTDRKWDAAMRKLGVDPATLSGHSGRA